MSGHSKWHSIKHKKALTDARKANTFTKMAKDIAVAARSGGDPETNFQLRMAIDKAKMVNLPKENIERAIKKGTGELKDGNQIEEIIYEAYGPGQIAMLIKVVTDNKNRTLGEIKKILQKNNGKFVEGGSVSWQFENVGTLFIKKNENKTEEEMEMDIIESGAKDYKKEDDSYRIFTDSKELQEKRNYFGEKYSIEEAELIFLAKNKINIDDKTATNYEKLYDMLEEHDDVIQIFDNIE